MIVNFEFLDEEPIENIITCLHYKVDKVIFFGDKELIAEKKSSMERFLKKHCNVKMVEFLVISDRDLNAVVQEMRSAITREREQKHECYFDVTGGEGLTLLAFGILSRELQVPMHMYDVEKDELLEFDKEYGNLISKNVPAQHIRLNLDKAIEMQGGVVSYKHNKGYKGQHNESDLADVRKLWKINQRFEREWNHFAMFLARYAQEMMVDLSAEIVQADMKTRRSIGSAKKLNQILDACGEAGILRNVKHENGRYSFTYKNEFVKSCMCDSGSVLEQYTFLQEQDNPNNADCRVGVHIDWDGVLHVESGMDVLNEIDVLSLYGNVPVFISCKGGSVDQNALYELDAVTSRFGGKYAKKVLVLSKPLSHGHALRAKEMGIEVRVL
ncbi:MAG: DUF1887 family protein [Roseburia sp.]|nr:DUF1887 family protein [Roseburia sp.]